MGAIEQEAVAKETIALVEAIVDRAAKRVGRQPDLEARRDTIREAVAEAIELIDGLKGEA